MCKKTTQKVIVSAINAGKVIDLTAYGFPEMQTLSKAHELRFVAFSSGVRGINGFLLRDENGQIYAVTSKARVFAPNYPDFAFVQYFSLFREA